MSVTTELGAHARMALQRPSTADAVLSASITTALEQFMASDRRTKSNAIRVLLAEALRARGYEVTR